MTSDRIVGPFILHDTMNAKRYLTMLKDEVWQIVIAWDNIKDFFSCNMEPLNTLLLLFVNG